MEILEKHKKLYNLHGKIIPKFVLTEPPNIELFDDIHHSITKYLGKINGILDKKLRNIWIKNDGFSINYSNLITGKIDCTNVTEIWFDQIYDIDIRVISKCVRIERIFLRNLGQFIWMVKKSIQEILDIFTNGTYPNFVGLFIDSNAYCFKSFKIYETYIEFLENYITSLRQISDKTDYLYTIFNIMDARIYTSFSQYEEHYELIEKHIMVCRYSHMQELERYRNEKSIKVLILDDPLTSMHYKLVLEPTYSELDIKLNPVIIGKVHRPKYMDADRDKVIKVYYSNTSTNLLDYCLYADTFESQ